jgi:hypothetical protein
MNVLFDQKQLLQLVTNLYVLTGMTANILDPKGQDINLFQDHRPSARQLTLCRRAMPAAWPATPGR